MSLIVAARLETFDQASAVAARLHAEGFPEDAIHTFYINTAGEHARYPIGGDRAADPDARGAHFGAVAGAAALGLVFAVIGGALASRMAGSTLLVIIAAGVGAYLGALAGALWITGRVRRPAAGQPLPHPPLREAGVMLALHVTPAQEGLARRVLREGGGHDIERARGRWAQGRWEDFDPLKPPQQAEPTSTTAQQ